ncbi:LamG domain-containing protein [Marinobacter sp.]|uniref:LamG domain-containing protein n=1 Tax=Marinobacter sp. TaxID=50741 RepID=UPI00384F76DA
MCPSTFSSSSDSSEYTMTASIRHNVSRSGRLLPLMLLSLLALAGCGGGEDTESLPNTGTTVTNANYNGPAPATDDVQNFKRSVWDNLVSTNRCGSCHAANGQSPAFVHDGDINIAWAQANTIVNLNDPSQSLMVTKVAGGHNCWLSSDSACADTLTSYIATWAGGSAGSAKTVELRPPQIKDPGATKVFPADSSEFENWVYPLLRNYCADCHVEGIQAPFVASDDRQLAYLDSQSRMDLENPASSRFVERLRDEFHNCWEGDCTTSAEEMQVAIEIYAATISTQPLDTELVASKALTLTGDGLLANAGGRFEDNVIALYEFKTGEGTTAFDTSGVEPALHLSLIGNVDWFGGWGITVGPAFLDETTGATVRNGKAQGTTTASRKIHDLFTASGEYSIEAWVVPANTTQEDARIVTYSGSSTTRNVTLSQTQQNYEVLHRSTTTDQNTAFATDGNDMRLQASLQHVVVNFTPGQGRRIFVNGEDTGDVDPSPAGLLNEWDDTFALVLGNETDGMSLWEGSLQLVAIHNRALSAEQIRTNFEVGVGQKYFLLFSIAHLIDIPESYVVFRVSQFDSHGYLFAEPFFISLDETQTPQGIPLEGLKLGINGREAAVGQAFATLELSLNSTDYTPGSGQVLSTQGTIIGLENGPDSDEFFLSFERLGDNENVVVEGSLSLAPVPADQPEAPSIGLKTFDEINASMAKVSTIATTHPPVAATFNTVRQQLPSVENINGFLSSQQMAVTQMAIQYCDALVSDTTKRAAFFPGFGFSASAQDAFDQAGKDLIINPLLAKMVGTGLDSQPEDTALRTELNALMDGLSSCGGSCASDRTETVVKASCAAVLGSAVTLVQ